MSSSVGEKVLTLKCNDGEEFTVKESVAIQSVMIKNMIKDHSTSNTVPITNVDSETLSIVLEYLNKHGDSAVSEDDKEKFDSEFVKKYDLTYLFFLIFAAYNLEIGDLLRLVAQTLADRKKNIVTAEEILQVFQRQE